MRPLPSICVWKRLEDHVFFYHSQNEFKRANHSLGIHIRANPSRISRDSRSVIISLSVLASIGMILVDIEVLFEVLFGYKKA